MDKSRRQSTTTSSDQERLESLTRIPTRVRKQLIIEALRQVGNESYLRGRAISLNFDVLMIEVIDRIGPEVAIPLMEKVHRNLQPSMKSNFSEVLKAFSRVLYELEIEWNVD